MRGVGRGGRAAGREHRMASPAPNGASAPASAPASASPRTPPGKRRQTAMATANGNNNNKMPKFRPTQHLSCANATHKTRGRHAHATAHFPFARYAIPRTQIELQHGLQHRLQHPRAHHRARGGKRQTPTTTTTNYPRFAPPSPCRFTQFTQHPTHKPRMRYAHATTHFPFARYAIPRTQIYI